MFMFYGKNVNNMKIKSMFFQKSSIFRIMFFDKDRFKIFMIIKLILRKILWIEKKINIIKC